MSTLAISPNSMALALPSLPNSALGSIESYISAVNQIPLLTLEQEVDYANRFRLQQDLDAARLMVMSHLRFVVHVARGYSGYGLPLSDLIQEGNIGLMKAVKRFDPTLGVRLVSFAVHWVKAEMHEFILKNWRIVKIATTKAQRKLFFNLRSSKQRLGWMNGNEVATIAQELGVPEATVLQMEQRLNGMDVSFDTPADDEDSPVAQPVAYLADPNADPAHLLEHANYDEQSLELLEQGLESLDARSQAILKRRWIDEPKATLHELADEYKVSAERIRQLEAAALKKLKARIGAELAL
jgi:RNA polymerase sigma-32 factor